MSRKFRTAIFLGLAALLSTSVNAQPVSRDNISADDAVRIALENNYDIAAAGIVKEVAGINTSKFNDGTLPVVSALGGAAYNFDHDKTKIEGAVARDNVHTVPFYAGVNVNYTLYDQSRSLYREQLAGLYDLSDLQLRQTIELTLVELLTAYWRVAQLEWNVRVRRENLAVSQRNLLRSEYAFEYGVSTRLGVLNNEVNVNNDSVDLIVGLVEFANAKRNLNILMGRDAEIEFSTDTTITFISDLNLEQLRLDALNNNVFIRMADQNIVLDQVAADLARTGWFPVLDVSGGYNWRQTPYIDNSVDYLSNHGLNGGVSMSWNIFDGGRSKTAVQNSRLYLEDSRLYREDLIRRIDRDVLNGWAAYQNALYVIEVQRKNIETSQRNFESSLEQYNLGNITTTTFREAQTNLLNAKLGLLAAFYQAKVSEIQLMQIAGRIAE